MDSFKSLHESTSYESQCEPPLKSKSNGADKRKVRFAIEDTTNYTTSKPHDPCKHGTKESECLFKPVHIPVLPSISCEDKEYYYDPQYVHRNCIIPPSTKQHVDVVTWVFDYMRTNTISYNLNIGQYERAMLFAGEIKCTMLEMFLFKLLSAVASDPRYYISIIYYCNTPKLFALAERTCLMNFIKRGTMHIEVTSRECTNEQLVRIAGITTLRLLMGLTKTQIEKTVTVANEELHKIALMFNLLDVSAYAQA